MPLDYRPAIISLLKFVLSTHYPEAYSANYDGAKQKSFTFSVALAKPNFTNEKILLKGNNVKISISSWDEFDSMLIYNAFQKSKGHCHPLSDGNSMTVKSVKISPVREVPGSQVIIKFLSPLVVRDHKLGEPDRYYVYDDIGFDECLNRVVSRQLGRDVSIRLRPADGKKAVIMLFGVKMRTSVGTYSLEAEPDILSRLLKGGIGSRRSEGFGHFILAGR